MMSILVLLILAVVAGAGVIWFVVVMSNKN